MKVGYYDRCNKCDENGPPVINLRKIGDKFKRIIDDEFCNQFSDSCAFLRRHKWELECGYDNLELMIDIFSE